MLTHILFSYYGLNLLHPSEMDRQVNWLNLPSPILALIYKKLIQIQDYIHFGAVCHPWRSLHLENNHCIPRQLPLLLCSYPYAKKHSFLSLSAKEVFNLSVPKLQTEYNCGSSHGWLVYKVYRAVCLFNPFLAVNNYRIIPNLDYITKAILSENPVVVPNYVVMAIYSRRLAFYRPGNRTWIFLDSDCNEVHDIIYYRDQFYAINTYGEIWVCDPRNPLPQVLKVVHHVDDISFWKRKYIVESSGELLQVRTTCVYNRKNICSSVAFEIFKLDQVADKWEELKSVGGEALFIGSNTSMSLLAADFPECKPNCIYFTEEYNQFETGKGNGLYGMGVYSLEDGSIEKLDQPFRFSAIWVEPTL